MKSRRRPPNWWRDYQRKLNAFANKARETAKIISDGDWDLGQRAYAHARQSYHWYEAGADGRGSLVFFCWTVHRDESGYFSTWREVHTDTELKRYDVVHRRRRASCAEIARNRYNAYVAKQPEPTIVEEHIEVETSTDTVVAARDDDDLIDWTFVRRKGRKQKMRTRP